MELKHFLWTSITTVTWFWQQKFCVGKSCQNPEIAVFLSVLLSSWGNWLWYALHIFTIHSPQVFQMPRVQGKVIRERSQKELCVSLIGRKNKRRITFLCRKKWGILSPWAILISLSSLLYYTIPFIRSLFHLCNDMGRCGWKENFLLKGHMPWERCLHLRNGRSSMLEPLDDIFVKECNMHTQGVSIVSSCRTHKRILSQ